ncbi:MAG: IS21 family transposase [Actinomycetota bacterium]|nr:IS21 family transposase [Actinomycetota bacterium]
MKSVRERMDMNAAYREVGTYRGAAAICGVTPKTVKRAVAAAERATKTTPRNYDSVADVVAERIEKTHGRISAKRLLPAARTAGYTGSARNFRRLVAKAKVTWRRDNHRGRRPGVWTPGDMLVIDWGQIGPLSVFCGVMAWSRWRFVVFADNQRSETTLAAMASCFEAMGGVPKTVLSDRMGCIKGATVANVVIPTADYVRFANHYSFRPDFCEGADPESKGLVENLVGYVKSDLMIPEGLSVDDLAGANAKAAAWCREVNSAVHSEIAAVPAERLASEAELLSPLPSLRARTGKLVVRKVDRLSCVRFGSARYSVPTRHVSRQVEVRVCDGVVQVVFLGEVIASHSVVSPGEASVSDDHYGGARPAPARAVRPKTTAEKAFCALGPVAESFIKGAASAGITGLAGDLEELASMEAAHGRDVLLAGLERAIAFRRFRAADVRSIIAAGRGVASPARPGEALVVALPVVATRSLADYAIGGEV